MNNHVFFRSNEASAVALHDGVKNQSEVLQQSGTRRKKLILNQPFDRLTVNGAIQVVFNFSEGDSVVEVNAEENHIDAIELKIDGSTLNVSCNHNPDLSGRTTFLVKVSHPMSVPQINESLHK